jgi:Domain of unknown function (DUF1905)
MEFSARLQLDGKTATGITVPEEVIEQLGAGKRPRVRVTINGFTFETTIGVMGGNYKIPVSAERRQAANINAGDELHVQVALAQPR